MWQQCIIIGNLGRDPEMRFTGDGTPVTSFSVAVNRRWTNQDGSQGEKTWWFRVTAWRRLAETCNQYLRKGSPVMVIGEVDASGWGGRAARLGGAGGPRRALPAARRHGPGRGHGRWRGHGLRHRRRGHPLLGVA